MKANLKVITDPAHLTASDNYSGGCLENQIILKKLSSIFPSSTNPTKYCLLIRGFLREDKLCPIHLSVRGPACISRENRNCHIQRFSWATEVCFHGILQEGNGCGSAQLHGGSMALPRPPHLCPFEQAVEHLNHQFVINNYDYFRYKTKTSFFKIFI